MLKELTFVKGAVSKKDIVASLSHFHIKDRGVYGHNGVIGLFSPIALEWTAVPKALPFIHAISSCKVEPSLHLSPTGRLIINSGKFRAMVPCLENTYVVTPDLPTTRVAVDGSFLDALRLVYPFIGEDASRPWSRGILFKENYLYATNNITLVRVRLPFTFPLTVNVPKVALQELLRIGEEPTYLLADERTLVFGFAEGRWLKTLLYSLAWPAVAELIEQHKKPLTSLPDDFFGILQKLKPFCDSTGGITFTPETIATTSLEELGALEEVVWPDSTVVAGNYSVDQLLALADYDLEMSLESYPGPVYFRSADSTFEGLLIGRRPT